MIAIAADLLVISLIILILDGIFIYAIKNMFMRQIELVQGSPLTVNVPSAVICYIFIITGLYYFILRCKDALVQEAFLLGVFVYGVYETTSMTVLRNWSPTTAMIDTAWGGVLFGLTTYIYKQYKQLN